VRRRLPGPAARLRPTWVRSWGPAVGGGRLPERGAAVVEFVVVFLALLVPLVYAIAVMADVQRALLATSSAAREVGRVYVTAADRADARSRTQRAYAEVLANYGLRAGGGRDRLEVAAACPAGAPAACAAGFGPGAEVRVVASYRVAVARFPFVGVVAGPSVTVGATHRTRADRFRGFRA
jgi:Flp pilus assembly protein TadG